MGKYCEWIKYDYRTICPRKHDAKNPYWRIPADTDKLKYCPYCGKKIVIK
nr:MAG TPA: restriction alleviation protein [Caudoviricetes sp.]